MEADKIHLSRLKMCIQGRLWCRAAIVTLSHWKKGLDHSPVKTLPQGIYVSFGACQHCECKLPYTERWLLTSSWSQLPNRALFSILAYKFKLWLKQVWENDVVSASPWNETNSHLSMKSRISRIKEMLRKESTHKYWRLNEGCLFNNTAHYCRKI